MNFKLLLHSLSLFSFIFSTGTWGNINNSILYDSLLNNTPIELSHHSFDLEEYLTQLESDLKEQESNIQDYDSCVSVISHRFQTLDQLRTEHFEFDFLTVASEDLDEFVARSFNIRIGMRAALERLRTGEGSQACLTAYKSLNRALRYLEDYLVEIRYLQAKKNEEKSFSTDPKEYVTLEGEGSFFQVNPKFVDSFRGREDLRSGDILLTRGGSSVSASIARLGTDDEQFSHLALVYRNSAGELKLIESLIESGTKIKPIGDLIDYPLSRIVVFRHPNPNTAELAALRMYAHVREYIDSNRRRNSIPYAFHMNIESADELFCSELVHWAYKWATDGELIIPRHMTKFSKGMIPLLQEIGVGITKENYKEFGTFAPSDMQFETAFEVVAEWRDPTRMRASRYMDIIFSRVFQMMEEEDNPVLNHSKSIELFAFSARAARQLPIMGRVLLGSRLSRDIRRGQIRVIATLDRIGNKLKSGLDATSEEYVLRTPLEIREALEEVVRQEF